MVHEHRQAESHTPPATPTHQPAQATNLKIAIMRQLLLKFCIHRQLCGTAFLNSHFFSVHACLDMAGA